LRACCGARSSAVRDLKRYWREVRELERGLPTFVWLVTVEDGSRGQRGGMIVEVPAAHAAKLLHARSHRAAAAEEIAEHQAKQSAKERREFHEDLRRKGITIIPIAGAEPEIAPPNQRRRNVR
jgi:hypothetical protein